MQINGFYGLMSYNLRQLDFFYTEYDQNIEKIRSICYNGAEKEGALWKIKKKRYRKNRFNFFCYLSNPIDFNYDGRY